MRRVKSALGMKFNLGAREAKAEKRSCRDSLNSTFESCYDGYVFEYYAL
jgi:hypothetical protein